MRRFLPIAALVATLLGALPAAGVAVAGDHDRGGGRQGGWAHARDDHGGGRGRGGPPPWARGRDRGPPPGWSRGEGRRERPDYGPPPGAYESHGYLRRGGRLPPDVRGEVVPDPGRYRLRQPPRGYNWVRVGGAFALMNMETGQLFDIIPD
jgi:Ni/Co efflux regulator RcnB